MREFLRKLVGMLWKPRQASPAALTDWRGQPLKMPGDLGARSSHPGTMGVELEPAGADLPGHDPAPSC